MIYIYLFRRWSFIVHNFATRLSAVNKPLWISCYGDNEYSLNFSWWMTCSTSQKEKSSCWPDVRDTHRNSYFRNWTLINLSEILSHDTWVNIRIKRLNLALALLRWTLKLRTSLSNQTKAERLYDWVDVHQGEGWRKIITTIKTMKVKTSSGWYGFKN